MLYSFCKAANATADCLLDSPSSAVVIRSIAFSCENVSGTNSRSGLQRVSAQGTVSANTTNEKLNTRSGASGVNIHTTFTVAPTLTGNPLMLLTSFNTSSPVHRRWIAPPRYPVTAELGTTNGISFHAITVPSAINAHTAHDNSDNMYRTPALRGRRGIRAGYWHHSDVCSDFSAVSTNPFTVASQNDNNSLCPQDWQNTQVNYSNVFLPNSYNVDFSLGVTNGLVVDNQLDAFGSLTLTDTNSLAVSALVDAVGSLTFTETSAMVVDGFITSLRSMALNETNGLTTGGGLSISGSVSLVETSSLLMRSVLAAVANVALNETNSLTVAALMAAVANVSFTETSGLTFTGLANFTRTIQLTELSALAASGNAQMLGTAALGGTLALAASGNIQMLCTAALGGTFGLVTGFTSISGTSTFLVHKNVVVVQSLSGFVTISSTVKSGSGVKTSFTATVKVVT